MKVQHVFVAAFTALTVSAAVASLHAQQTRTGANGGVGAYFQRRHQPVSRYSVDLLACGRNDAVPY